MKKNNPVYTNAALLVGLLIAAAFALRLITHKEALPSPRQAEPNRHVSSAPGDIKPAPRIYDMHKLKGGGEPLNTPNGIRITPDDIREAKEWRDADPIVKKELIEELDANIANSKKILESDPDNTMAKRILLASERRKTIEINNFEGKYLGKDVKIEDVDTAAAR
jgi:hypothetical protein